MQAGEQCKRHICNFSRHMLAPVRTALSGRVMSDAYSQTFSEGLRKDPQLGRRLEPAAREPRAAGPDLAVSL